jgi:Domain of Unknown Function (DUF1259)
MKFGTLLPIVGAVAMVAAQASSQAGPGADWSAVTAAIGRTGALQPDGVMKYGFPRGDLAVTLGGVGIKPALALGSWVAFKRTDGRKVMVMGDLVLAESEVQPVLARLDARGVHPSAVHNHLVGESPRVVYVHISAEGEAEAIAATIRSALSLTGTPAPTAPSGNVTGSFGLDTSALHRSLGRAGKVNGGVYQVSVPRHDQIRMNGRIIPPSMGVSTAINFQPTGDGRAAITGDFVMEANEVNRVLPILREGGIAITALHSHMVGENPRLYFMHFWANDDALRVARSLRSALDQLK